MATAIKISKEGIDVLTATNPNDFIFHSSYNTFKIILSGTIISQTVSGTTTFEITHGISGIPIVYALAKFPDNNIYLPGSFQPSTTSMGSRTRAWDVFVDSNKVYFKFYEDGGNYTISLRYYIFEPVI